MNQWWGWCDDADDDEKDCGDGTVGLINGHFY